MTDFNNGQIYGWNGGECPVHSKTVVQLWMRNGLVGNGTADDLVWKHLNSFSDIIAFRVVHPFKEPKMVWMNEYKDGAHYAYDSEESAKAGATEYAVRTGVRYQEVIENE